MANPNSPFGLRLARSSSAFASQVNEYVHAASDGTGLFKGDPVVSNQTPTSTSGNQPYPDGTPICTASGTITTTPIRGAVAGVRPTLTNLTLQYCPASTLSGILVLDNPLATFEVQTNGTFQIGDVGDTMGLTSGAGSTTSGYSKYVATESTGHAANAYVLRILRLAPVVNNILGANSILEVRINLHELLTTTTP